MQPIVQYLPGIGHVLLHQLGAICLSKGFGGVGGSVRSVVQAIGFVLIVERTDLEEKAYYSHQQHEGNKLPSPGPIAKGAHQHDDHGTHQQDAGCRWDDEDLMVHEKAQCDEEDKRQDLEDEHINMMLAEDGE